MEEALLKSTDVAAGTSRTTHGALSLSEREPRQLLIGAVVGVALMVIVFWDFFHRQIRWGLEEPADWGHTLVIPLIAGYFVYLKREALLSTPFRTTWFGLLFIMAGVAWYMLCMFGPRVLFHHNLHAGGVAVTLFGAVLLLLGPRATLLLLFPLVYLTIFGQTISHSLLERVTFQLQDITARGSTVLLKLFGVDVTRIGNTLYVFDDARGREHPLNIAEACSGMRMLMAFLALGVAMAYTGLKRFWQRALLVLFAIPTAIVVNILRVCTLSYLSFHDTNFTAGDFHTFIGLVWLIPAFFIYLGLMWIIRNLIVERPSSASAATGGAR